jgi:hypothetical protein
MTTSRPRAAAAANGAGAARDRGPCGGRGTAAPVATRPEDCRRARAPREPRGATPPRPAHSRPRRPRTGRSFAAPPPKARGPGSGSRSPPSPERPGSGRDGGAYAAACEPGRRATRKDCGRGRGEGGGAPGRALPRPRADLFPPPQVAKSLGASLAAWSAPAACSGGREVLRGLARGFATDGARRDLPCRGERGPLGAAARPRLRPGRAAGPRGGRPGAGGAAALQLEAAAGGVRARGRRAPAPPPGAGRRPQQAVAARPVDRGARPLRPNPAPRRPRAPPRPAQQTRSRARTWRTTWRTAPTPRPRPRSGRSSGRPTRLRPRVRPRSRRRRSRSSRSPPRWSASTRPPRSWRPASRWGARGEGGVMRAVEGTGAVAADQWGPRPHASAAAAAPRRRVPAAGSGRACRGTGGSIRRGAAAGDAAPTPLCPALRPLPPTRASTSRCRTTRTAAARPR